MIITYRKHFLEIANGQSYSINIAEIYRRQRHSEKDDLFVTDEITTDDSDHPLLTSNQFNDKINFNTCIQ
jgi:hypothetical protein